MPTPLRTTILRAAVAAASIALCASSAFAAPTAKQYQCSLTSPPFATGSTIKITKPSKVIVKGATGSITFQLKIGGITDAMDQLVDLNNNTMQVDFIRPNGMLVTAMFSFNITAGKVSQKSPLDNTNFPGGVLNPGETVDIRRVHLIQAGNGNDFAVCGITIK